MSTYTGWCICAEPFKYSATFIINLHQVNYREHDNKQLGVMATS